ncbi:P-loop containing nucleoside triphosphate hydrolase protein [Obelidium mucronatum]|nr:P-loop containing nucleoside triphosphate hydrolase protein [Obelidium mucronatum]
MDIFAKPFIPDWLKDINMIPAREYPGPPPPAPYLYMYVLLWISPAYGALGGSKVEIEYASEKASQIALGVINVPFVIQQSDASDILPFLHTTYSQRYIHLVGLEAGSRIQEMKSFTMYGVRILGSAALWEVAVPGVVEDSPNIQIGDLIKLRKVSPFDGNEYEFCFLDVVRRKSAVYFHHPELPNWSANDLFNIEFQYTDIALRYATRSLLDLEKHVETGYARKFIFPEPEDAIMSLGTQAKTSLDLGLDFRDDQLNWIQKKAVSAIVKNKYGDIPYLVWGPPGTGKTRTVIEAIFQIITLQPDARILACAPSHSAADTLTLRLKKFLSPQLLLRFNPPTRPSSEVPGEILAYTYSVNEPDIINPHVFMGTSVFSIPSMESLLQKRVVVSACEDSGLLMQCGLSNTFMNETYQVYRDRLKTMNPFFSYGVDDSQRGLFWTHLFIDEAGQATEPESMIPISLVACEPLISNARVASPQLILSGDHMQLGPVVHSEAARRHGLGVSYFERLIRRPLYRDHPESRCIPRTLNVDAVAIPPDANEAASLVLNDCVAPFANLINNYRSHPSFLMTPSHLYYNGTLTPEAPKSLTHAFIGASFLPNPDIPILFYGIQAKEERSLNQASMNNESEGSAAAWYNPAEAAKILEYVTLLSRLEGVGLKDFGIISPFREQVKVIRELLRANRLGSVDVGTVEDYQGMERSIILISTSDPQWVSFLAFYFRNGCYTGCSVPKTVLDASVAKASDDGLDNNYGKLEQARDVAHNMMNAPPSRWLGVAAGGEAGIRNDVESDLDWTHELLEQFGM